MFWLNALVGSSSGLKLKTLLNTSVMDVVPEPAPLIVRVWPADAP
jgi:hypothetical protein